MAATDKTSAKAKHKHEHPLSTELKDAAETYRQAITSSATSSLDNIHSSLRNRLDSSSTSPPPTEQWSRTDDHDSTRPNAEPNTSTTSIAHLPSLVASLAETDRRLVTPLAEEILRFARPSTTLGGGDSSSSAETVTVRLETQMENFAALVARERVKVQGLFGKRDEVVRRIEELMEGLSMSGGEVGRPGKQERKGEEGKGKSEREEVVGLQEQWMALEADFAETVEALKEEVVTIGDETLEVAMEQEKELDAQRRERNKHFLDYAQRQL